VKVRVRLAADEGGAAAVEMAFAIPILIVMIWAFVQLAEVYRAVAGMQQALGEGARYATLCVSQSATGCTAPTGPQIKTKIQSSVYGIGPGTFTVNDPVSGTSGTAKYYDLTVSYSQPTDLLMFPGPTMSLSRSKKVWIATSA
jgi:Flp pilus assembly protein TadG